jgi:CAAX prenyl protease-like protein
MAQTAYEVEAPAGRHVGSLPYVAPFLVFILLLAIAPSLDFLGPWEPLIRVLVIAAVLMSVSRPVLDFRIRSGAATVSLGVAVFVIWILPDVLWPGYRSHFLFQNGLTGYLTSSIPENMRIDPLVLGPRAFRAIILVPIVEELFWRAWMMRWLISPRFEQVPLGSYSLNSVLITAVLFASEHGPYWDVGLVAGLLYNWWMIRTKSLGDCILAHAVTNACLSAYLLATGKWEYWL